MSHHSDVSGGVPWQADNYTGEVPGRVNRRWVVIDERMQGYALIELAEGEE
jgi:hypothetical protein